MKPTDFAYYLSAFFTKYLPNVCGLSPNTVSSYRDSFILFFGYLRDEKGMRIEKLQLKDFHKDLVGEFLDWIENGRNCSVATRNVRLTAIHSFFRYLQFEYPDFIFEWQKILDIPVKKSERGTLTYMTLDGIKLLLEMPDLCTKSGRRDVALLSLMYDTAARVQEVADLTPSMVRLSAPSTIKLVGKGKKARIVPLMEKQADILSQYMIEKGLNSPCSNQYPLFAGRKGGKFTRAGISYILRKYVELARVKNASLVPLQFTPHCLRHSKAMHLLQSGVNIVYIRDLLGHVSVQTTEIYARTDSSKKREAFEKAYVDVSPELKPQWEGNHDLIEWLRTFIT
ncbi:MAG: site-specific integrase [Spirochaetia bacterium]|jgi:integrase/recombinase XerD|nr:site-specific integrase [Spirochaetia bacterium]